MWSPDVNPSTISVGGPAQLTNRSLDRLIVFLMLTVNIVLYIHPSFGLLPYLPISRTLRHQVILMLIVASIEFISPVASFVVKSIIPLSISSSRHTSCGIITMSSKLMLMGHSDGVSPLSDNNVPKLSYMMGSNNFTAV